ncbi:MAG: hypothetical protein JPMHGGIA_01400 [Saprospiraceae bacterium]|jgi:hypothetical protein|nr:hypothetical protein [Saprospiraceae bacterium]
MNQKTNPRKTLLHLALLFPITLISVWLVHDYIGFFLALLVASISSTTLGISLIAEKLERSHLPNWYSTLLGILIIESLLIILFMLSLDGFALPFGN